MSVDAKTACENIYYVELQRCRSREQSRAAKVENEKDRAERMQKLVAAVALCIWSKEL